METPRFKHDCTNDIFLGQFEQFDLYFADHGGHTKDYKPDSSTIIARYGDEGYEYISAIAFNGIDAAISEGIRRSVEKGYLIKK